MNKYGIEDDRKIVKIWFNGRTAEHMMEVEISKNINSIRRLKDKISSHLNFKSSAMMRIFNHKGLEMDDADIDYLINNQVIYVSLDGSAFNLVNYINELEFTKLIKSGGFGKVYLARNVLSGEELAVKKLDISNVKSEEIYNIYREALYLESFRHKNIIKFYHSFIYEGNFYSVMDYAKGGELSTLLSSEKFLPESTAKKLFRQIHDAVIYMHSKNVIHRDLKPNNILFLDEKKENLVVIDFGISGFYSGNIKEKIKAGTTRFLPPELASGYNYTSNPKIDIWALGIILYYLLFGFYPFDGNDSADIQKKIVNEEHKFPTFPSISQSCKLLINGMLEKNQHIRVDAHDRLFQNWYDDLETLETITARNDDDAFQSFINSSVISSVVIPSKNTFNITGLHQKKQSIPQVSNLSSLRMDKDSSRHYSENPTNRQSKKTKSFLIKKSILLSNSPKKPEKGKPNESYSMKVFSPNKELVKAGLFSFAKNGPKLYQKK